LKAVLTIGCTIKRVTITNVMLDCQNIQTMALMHVITQKVRFTDFVNN